LSIIAAAGATPIVQRFVLNLNTLLASTPPVEPERAGTKRRIAREKAQAKRVAEQDKARAKALKVKAKPADVDFLPDGRVMVRGVLVGTTEERGDKTVLFDKDGNEVSERARQRDLKKAAAGLFDAPGKPAVSRQVRRAMERRGIASKIAAAKRAAMKDKVPGGSATIRSI